MKQFTMSLLTATVFLVGKVVGGDLFYLGSGVLGYAATAFVALVGWLAVARVATKLESIQQGLLFTILDAVWRAWIYVGRHEIPSWELLHDAPLAYFFVVYCIQALVIVGLLSLLTKVPTALDRWLCLPLWMKRRFGQP